MRWQGLLQRDGLAVEELLGVATIALVCPPDLVVTGKVVDDGVWEDAKQERGLVS